MRGVKDNTIYRKRLEDSGRQNGEKTQEMTGLRIKFFPTPSYFEGFGLLVGN